VEAAVLQERAHRGGGHPLAQGADHAARHEDVLGLLGAHDPVCLMGKCASTPARTRRLVARAFGSSGSQLPAIGQGTWKLERDGPTEAVAALRRGVELGMTHVDTAEMYGMGEVEELLSRALEGWRDRVFLVSKVLPQNASFAGTIKSCESSLRRLGTDRL